MPMLDHSSWVFPLVLKITQFNANCDLFLIRTYYTHLESMSSLPSDSFQEIKRINTFIIKIEFMQARARNKSQITGFSIWTLFHYCSMIFEINVPLLQVQSKHSQNANFVFRVRHALQALSQLMCKNVWSAIFTSMGRGWGSYIKH